MGLWRVRVELDDRRGALGALGTALGAIDVSILDLDVHLTGAGVAADDLVIDLGWCDPPAVETALGRLGARVRAMSPVDAHSFVDRIGSAVAIGARVAPSSTTLEELTAAAAELVPCDAAVVLSDLEVEDGAIGDALARGTPFAGRLSARFVADGELAADVVALAVPAREDQVLVLGRVAPPFSGTEVGRLRSLVEVFRTAPAAERAVV